MKQDSLITRALVLAGLMMSPLTFADGLFGSGHYSAGISNIRDLTVPREAGFIYEQYNIYYSANKLTDSSGNTLTSEGHYNVLAIAPTFIWVTEQQILGARYAFTVNPLLVDTDASGQDASGIGDLFIQPLWLGWQAPQYDINLGLGLYAPTGNSDVTLDLWTFQLQTAGYYYLMEGAGALMLALTYEAHTESGSTKVTPGNHLSLEYGYSQYLTQQLEVGIRGYSQWQVENDDITDRHSKINEALNTSIGAKSQVHGVGISVGYWINGNWNITANAATEFESKARIEGESYSLNITYLPKAIF